MKNINNKIIDIEKERNAAKKNFDELKLNSNDKTYNPNEFDLILLLVNDQQYKVDEEFGKLNQIDLDLD